MHRRKLKLSRDRLEEAFWQSATNAFFPTVISYDNRKKWQKII
jgi:hypothetical protein